MLGRATTILGLFVVTAAVAACGGSGSNSGAAAAVNSGRPNLEYVVRLSGATESPPTPGIGYAIVAFHDGAHEICYRFAHLHRFVDATGAHIRHGGANQIGPVVLALSAGPRLHHRGCVRASAGLMSSIAGDPRAYYVEIRSVDNPHGAVRAQLSPSASTASHAGGGSATGTGASAPATTTHTTTPAPAAPATTRVAITQTTVAAPTPPPFPHLLAGALASTPGGFTPAISWHGETAVRVEHTAGGVALIAFDQRLVQVHLHAGTVDPGGSGWRYGPAVSGPEVRHMIAAFNGGFKLNTGAGGFMYGGRVGWPLSVKLGSVVTYTTGRTDIGSWRIEVPAPGLKVASVRQNLPLLIDHGVAAADVGCITCWGATLGGVTAPARSGLGITANGTLVWAGAEHLTPSELADALLSAHVVRAVQNDINPAWVAAYFYGHRGGRGPLAPVSVVPGQNGVSGEFLAPYSRDFFTVVAR
jgi:hypothetical protein